MNPCTACGDPTDHQGDTLGLCADCDDIAPAHPVEPPTAAEQFRALDHVYAIWLPERTPVPWEERPDRHKT